MDRLEPSDPPRAGRIGPMDRTCGDRERVTRRGVRRSRETPARPAWRRVTARSVNTRRRPGRSRSGASAGILEQLRRAGERRRRRFLCAGTDSDPVADPRAACSGCSRGLRRGTAPRSRICRRIEDEELRELVSRAAAAGLAEPDPTGVLIHWLRRKGSFAGFLMAETAYTAKDSPFWRVSSPSGPTGMYSAPPARRLHHLVYEGVRNLSRRRGARGNNESVEVTLHPTTRSRRRRAGASVDRSRAGMSAMTVV